MFKGAANGLEIMLRAAMGTDPKTGEPIWDKTISLVQRFVTGGQLDKLLKFADDVDKLNTMLGEMNERLARLEARGVRGETTQPDPGSRGLGPLVPSDDRSRDLSRGNGTDLGAGGASDACSAPHANGSQTSANH